MSSPIASNLDNLALKTEPSPRSTSPALPSLTDENLDSHVNSLKRSQHLKEDLQKRYSMDIYEYTQKMWTEAKRCQSLSTMSPIDGNSLISSSSSTDTVHTLKSDSPAPTVL